MKVTKESNKIENKKCMIESKIYVSYINSYNSYKSEL